jgi:hypothetical protein
MVVVYTDNMGVVHCEGSKILRDIFNISSFKDDILKSPSWENEEVSGFNHVTLNKRVISFLQVLKNTNLNESYRAVMPAPAKPLKDMGADGLRRFLQMVMNVLNSGRPRYSNQPKPAYWPSEIDYVNPQHRKDFSTTDAVKFRKCYLS